MPFLLWLWGRLKWPLLALGLAYTALQVWVRGEQAKKDLKETRKSVEKANDAITAGEAASSAPGTVDDKLRSGGWLRDDE